MSLCFLSSSYPISVTRNWPRMRPHRVGASCLTSGTQAWLPGMPTYPCHRLVQSPMSTPTWDPPAHSFIQQIPTDYPLCAHQALHWVLCSQKGALQVP